MDKHAQMALQVTKEVVVKFIEIGRISPGNFGDYFGPIYEEVHKTIAPAQATPPLQPPIAEQLDTPGTTGSSKSSD